MIKYTIWALLCGYRIPAKGAGIMRWSKKFALRRSPRRRLSVEQCEPRQLLAVTTSFDSGTGTLTITGDAGADDVAIFGTANPGEFTVQGHNGTSVNGVADGSATIGGVTNDLIANFGNGDNIISVDNVYLDGNLTIETGNGADVVVFGATGVVSSTGECQVLHSGGGDVFRAEPYKVFILGRLLVRGADTATLTGASSRGNILVVAHPEVLLRGVTASGDIEVRATGTNNSIAVFTSACSRLIIDTPSAQNSIYSDTCYAGAIEVFAQSSLFLPGSPPTGIPPHNINDTITIARCQTSRVLVNTTNTQGNPPTYIGGDDTVFIYGNSLSGSSINGPLHVETGDGNDNVSASYNIVLGDLFVSLAQLDDTLTLVGNQITGFASADGGTGRNRLDLIGNQFGGSAFNRF
jgi:hypothetical protein